MGLPLVYLFLVFTNVFLIESCGRYSILRSDDNNNCQKWWNEAYNLPSKENEKIRRCISLIKEKCPGIITLENISVEKTLKKRYTLKKVTKRATHIKRNESFSFKSIEMSSICADDDGKDGECDFWWKAAMGLTTENRIIDHCVNHILNHCKDQISLVRICTEIKSYNLRRFEATSYTYQYKNQDMVTFYRIEFL